MKILAILVLAVFGIATATYRQRCPTPKVSYGIISRYHKSSHNKYYYKGDKIKIKCYTGYTLVGKDYSVCSEQDYAPDLYWYPSLPKCIKKVIVYCANPGAPTDGQINTGSKVKVGGVVIWSCDYGYKLVGDYKATCQSNGNFDNHRPKCFRNYCDNPGDPDNGEVDPDTSKILVGKSVDFECDDGFYLDGEETLTCKSNLKFNYPKPTCEPLKCIVPRAPADGSVSPKTGDKVSVGKKIHYKCDDGFYLSGKDQATCLRGPSKFSSGTPTCIPLKCIVPKAPAYGSVSPKTGDKVSVGKKIHYKCDDGFYLSGKDQATCLRGPSKFSSGPPTCIRVCSRPPVPSYGRISPDKKVYFENAWVTYSCTRGKLFGSSKRQCRHGKWTGRTPNCLVIYYPTPTIYYPGDDGYFPPDDDQYRK